MECQFPNPIKGRVAELFGKVTDIAADPTDTGSDPNSTEEQTKVSAKVRPGRIKINSDVNRLILEIDVGNPSLNEVAKIKNEFCVSHLLYQESETSDRIWIALASEVTQTLKSDDATLSVPILNKQLPVPARLSRNDYQSVKIPKKGETDQSKIISSIRKWDFDFKISHDRATYQDDYQIEFDFNIGLNASNDAKLFDKSRTVGEILYEVQKNRDLFDGFKEDIDKYVVLKRWMDELSVSLMNDSNFVATKSLSSKTEKPKLYLSINQGKDRLETIYKLSWNVGKFRQGISFEIQKNQDDPKLKKTTKKGPGDWQHVIYTIPGSLPENGTEYRIQRTIRIKNLDIMYEANILPIVQVQRNRTLSVDGEKFVNDPFVLTSEVTALASPYTPLKQVKSTVFGGAARLTNQHKTISQSLSKFLEKLYAHDLIPGRESILPEYDMRWGFEALSNVSSSNNFHGPDPIAMLSVKPYDAKDSSLIVNPSIEAWINNSGVPKAGQYEFDLRLYVGNSGTPVVRLERLYVKLE